MEMRERLHRSKRMGLVGVDLGKVTHLNMYGNLMIVPTILDSFH
jgi:hypothetical protein